MDETLMRKPPKTLAEAVEWSHDGLNAFAVLLDEFLDFFYTEDTTAMRQAMIDPEPLRLGVERTDAYVGAVGEHLARRWGLTVPAWTEASWRMVAEPWFVGPLGLRLAPLLLAESPVAFRRRRIFTEAEPLRRVRMPRG